ncbi:GNAT family N-acetyltransferase [Parabacteroides sp. OttesenSCG-928-G07]|nr:GNAT family N-acetyltransferase [Parabacteroides sp. OttesenSCG-928-G21]MDL2278708.1 GNAT family N-acetyltransferase [Parabacteroides sp. OttesenSCG-928-G07]
MKSTDKEKYIALCETESTIPVYSRSWWLDTVCGVDNWTVLLVEEKGRIQAAMPIYSPLRKGITMPPYTQTMGVWFAPFSADTKYTSALTERQTICNSLIEKLSGTSFFLQNFHHSFTDWLPFYWKGYKQMTRYTYLLPDISEPTVLWEHMSSNIRRNINKAGEKNKIGVKRGISVEDFMRIYTKTFERQQLKTPNAKILEQLIAVSRERGQGDLWGGYDEKGQLHAVVFVVWQDSSAYYIAGGGDPALRDSGAHSLVMWEAIQAVSAYTDCFDFEGSMIPGVERFFREFGAVQTPYFTISKGKMSLLHRIRMKIQKQ